MTVTRLFNQLLDWHRNRDTISHLLALPDRQLSDMGLSRRAVISAVQAGARSGVPKDA